MNDFKVTRKICIWYIIVFGLASLFYVITSGGSEERYPVLLWYINLPWTQLGSHIEALEYSKIFGGLARKLVHWNYNFHESFAVFFGETWGDILSCFIEGFTTYLVIGLCFDFLLGMDRKKKDGVSKIK